MDVVAAAGLLPARPLVDDEQGVHVAVAVPVVQVEVYGRVRLLAGFLHQCRRPGRAVVIAVVIVAVVGPVPHRRHLAGDGEVAVGDLVVVLLHGLGGPGPVEQHLLVAPARVIDGIGVGVGEVDEDDDGPHRVARRQLAHRSRLVHAGFFLEIKIPAQFPAVPAPVHQARTERHGLGCHAGRGHHNGDPHDLSHGSFLLLSF